MPGGELADPISDAVTRLARLPVGPALSAALARLDLKMLTGSQVVDVLRARYRQHNHERAQLLAVTAEVMHRNEPDSVRSIPSDVWPGEFAADEVRAALVFSRNAAEKLCMLAEDVVRRLPEVQAAFASGVLDQPRVWVFSSWTSGLSDEHVRAIVAALLPKAHLLTTAQLIHEMQRHAIALDPTWARRRYERALKGRRVVGRRNEDGTANLAGYDLPVDQVAAACARLDRLAKAAKQAGHPDPIDHVRSYLFLGMTDGTFEGLTDPQILARLLAEAKLTQPAPAAPSTNDSSTNDSPDLGPPADDRPADHDRGADERPADETSTEDTPADPLADAPSFAGAAGPAGPASTSRGTQGSDDPEQDDNDPGQDDGGPDDGGPRPDGPGEGGPGPGEGGPGPGEGGPGPGEGGPGPGEGGPGPGEGGPGPVDGGTGSGEGGPDRGGAVGRTSGLRLLVGLASLVGADQRPAEVIGWGAVHAELARTIAAAPGASWWYVLADLDGAPLAIGPVRSRPHGPCPGGRGHPGLQVWIQVNQATLDALARGEHPPGWDQVIAEITAKAEANTGPPNGDPTARLPGAALRRWISVRDRTCVYPGCRVPAHRSDADHTIEHADGGETTDTNLGANCRHDHRLRHDGGWILEQTSPGRFTWTSRLGQTHHRTPPSDLHDLPGPMPTAQGGDEDDADEDADPSTEDWQNSTCMEPERPRRPAPPPPPPPVPPEDDPPPF